MLYLFIYYQNITHLLTFGLFRVCSTIERLSTMSQEKAASLPDFKCNLLLIVLLVEGIISGYLCHEVG